MMMMMTMMTMIMMMVMGMAIMIIIIVVVIIFISVIIIVIMMMIMMIMMMMMIIMIMIMMIMMMAMGMATGIKLIRRCVLRSFPHTHTHLNHNGITALCHDPEYSLVQILQQLVFRFKSVVKENTSVHALLNPVIWPPNLLD